MFGERLHLARKKSGYSLRSLSDALGRKASAQAIGKYERGEMMPSSSVLLALAKTLDVSLEYLLSEQVEKLEEVEFRKLSGTSAKDRARVEAVVIDSLQRYIAVEKILGLDSNSWRSPKFGNRFLGLADEGEILATDVRKEWNLGIDPIPNMTALLEDQGIKILVLPLPAGVSGLTALVRRPNYKRALPVIVVSQNITLERRRLTLAHELAHRLMDPDSTVDHERASNVFAGAFLVPKAHLTREIGERRNAFGYQEIICLKRMYRVSAAAFLVRSMQLGILSESALSYVFQTFARQWRSVEPEPLEEKSEGGTHELPRRFERLCYWALAEKLISLVKAGELLRQPLSEIEKGLKGPVAADASCSQ